MTSQDFRFAICDLGSAICKDMTSHSLRHPLIEGCGKGSKGIPGQVNLKSQIAILKLSRQHFGLLSSEEAGLHWCDSGPCGTQRATLRRNAGCRSPGSPG